LMVTSSVRDHTMATSKDGTFENGLGLPLNAQIDSDFFVSRGRVSRSNGTYMARTRYVLP
jgi:hypothetical protein